MQLKSILADGFISLRAPHMEDLPQMYQAVLESLEALSPWMSWAHGGYQMQEARDFIAACQHGWEQDTFYGFSIYSCQDGVYLGGVSLNHIDRSFRLCNLAYWVRTSHRSQGIAARASRLAARFAFEQLELVRVEIVVAVDNQASLQVATKTGAKKEGVLRNRLIVRETYQDAVMHSLIPQDFGIEMR